MKSLQGHLLVATPRLPDANFYRTVVLMIQHTDQGALGVVLNRPITKTVEQLWEEVGQSPCSSTQHVNLGGPVSGPLMAVHTDENLAEMEIITGIFLAAQKDNLDRLVRQQKHRYRIFLGHSGWGGGQLDGELEQGAWLTVPATIEFVFHDEERLWETVAKHIGDSLLTDSLKIKHVPKDPSMN